VDRESKKCRFDRDEYAYLNEINRDLKHLILLAQTYQLVEENVFTNHPSTLVTVTPSNFT
jgi:hypothetical protein